MINLQLPVAVAFLARAVAGVNNGLARTPQMGWVISIPNYLCPSLANMISLEQLELSRL